MFANVNGYKLFFDVEGLQYVTDGAKMREKPVCFVLHGGPGMDRTSFLPSLSPLSDVMQLVYVDDRNCGLSERIDATTNSMKQNVEDLEALREYLGLDKIFIIGHSYGGMKAQYYRINHPEHLYGAIILTSSPSAECISNARVASHIKETGTEEQYKIWTSGALPKGEISFTDYWRKMGNLYHGEGKFNLTEYLESVARGIKNGAVVMHQMSENGDMRYFDYTEDLKSVKIPCLVIAGEIDPITDERANRIIAENIPDCEYHVIKGASHEVLDDYPEIVLPIIEKYVDRVFGKKD